ncbi:MAG: HigA family addiction module antidote protein [Muribaculaceae bacterium]|nr:HigA family addiction module antidote protein [Muribaculaceae bacterium]
MTRPLEHISSPGELIKSELQERHITQKDFAEAVGIVQSHLSDILKGRRRITLSIAIKTEDLLGISSHTLMNLQTAQDIVIKDRGCSDQTELKARSELDIIDSVISVKTLLKRLHIKLKTNVEKVKALQSFYGVSSSNVKDLAYSFTCGCYRKSSSTGMDKRMIDSWVVIARATSRKLKPAGHFDMGNIDKLCEAVAALLHRNEGSVLCDLRNLLSYYGIGLLQIDKVDHASIDGYSFFSEGIPYIALTCRYDRIDNLAFTVLHELGHIALGHTTERKSQLNIDIRSFDEEFEDNIEEQANKFAGEILIPSSVWQFAPKMSLIPYIIQSRYTEWAHSKKLNPWIVLGRLSHETGMYKFRSDDSRKIRGGKEGLCYELTA